MNTTSNRGKSRFVEISRKLLIENRKTLMITIGAYLGICAVIGIWQGMTGNIAGEGTMVAYALLAGFACAVAASLTFGDLGSKEGRIAFLMTPGTAFSKFIPRVLTSVIGMIILAVAGYYVWMLSDVLAFGLRFSTWVPIELYFPEIKLTEDMCLGILALISMLLFNEFLYLFGSAAWPKKSFLKTTGIFIALQIVLNMIALVVIKNFHMDIDETEIIAILWCVVGFIFLVDAGLIYASYKMVERKQVI